MEDDTIRDALLTEGIFAISQPEDVPVRAYETVQRLIRTMRKDGFIFDYVYLDRNIVALVTDDELRGADDRMSGDVIERMIEAAMADYY
jgi:hypothetical protein